MESSIECIELQHLVVNEKLERIYLLDQNGEKIGCYRVTNDAGTLRLNYDQAFIPKNKETVLHLHIAYDKVRTYLRQKYGNVMVDINVNIL